MLKSHSEDFYNVIYTNCYWGDQRKEVEVVGACSTRRVDDKRIHSFTQKTKGEETSLET